MERGGLGSAGIAGSTSAASAQLAAAVKPPTDPLHVIEKNKSARYSKQAL